MTKLPTHEELDYGHITLNEDDYKTQADLELEAQAAGFTPDEEGIRQMLALEAYLDADREDCWSFNY